MKQKKCLITGITGFVGSWMAEYLLEKEQEVWGAKRWRSPMNNVKHIADKIKFVDWDLTDAISAKHMIEEVEPDVIYHLAAQSYVPFSFKSPLSTLNANILGTTNLLEAIRTVDIDPIIHVCSSSEVYGQVKKEDVPIKETCPLRPQSPYGVSKVGEDLISYQYYRSYGMKTIRTRMFTHSVSKWTPVILRDMRCGLMDIKYISEIRQKQKKRGYLSGKIMKDGTQIWNLKRHNLEVWNDDKWTKIKHISCHPIRHHKLLEITCRSGVIDVTDNHSVIDDKGKDIMAGNLKKGDKIKITNLPMIRMTTMHEDLAWFYGFFVADGCVTGGRMRVDNNVVKRLKKAKDILLKHLGVDSDIELGGLGRGTYRLTYRLAVKKPFEQAKRFYKDCYASDKNKKIPMIILNSDKKTKLAFLRGYNEGDGDMANNIKSEFYRFKTKSPILALGICLLLDNLNIKYRIHVEHMANNRYFEIRCLSQKKTKNGNWLLKDNDSITKITKLDYSDEVWDFETENHWFHAGIGGNIVHNTGPRRGDVFVTSAFAKQIAAIELGLQKPKLKAGNLDSVRTFADVRDATHAYWLLTKKCPAGEVYNIGGEATMTVKEMLDKLLGMTNKKIKAVVDKSLLRPSDVTLQIPCTDKFRKTTGWKPRIPFEKTLQDLLNYWRDELK